MFNVTAVKCWERDRKGEKQECMWRKEGGWVAIHNGTRGSHPSSLATCRPPFPHAHAWGWQLQHTEPPPLRKGGRVTPLANQVLRAPGVQPMGWPWPWRRRRVVRDGPCLSVGGAHVSSPGRWEVGEARVLHPGSFRVQLFPASFCLGFGRAGTAPAEEDPSTASELPALRGQSPITIVPSAG